MTEPLLNVAEAAALLGVAPSWVYGKIETPTCDVPFYRVGRYLRFKASELDAYLEANQGGPRR